MPCTDILMISPLPGVIPPWRARAFQNAGQAYPHHAIRRCYDGSGIPAMPYGVIHACRVAGAKHLDDRPLRQGIVYLIDLLIGPWNEPLQRSRARQPGWRAIGQSLGTLRTNNGRRRRPSPGTGLSPYPCQQKRPIRPKPYRYHIAALATAPCAPMDTRQLFTQKAARFITAMRNLFQSGAPDHRRHAPGFKPQAAPQ